MSKKTWLILILILSSLCVVGGSCVAFAYVGSRVISRGREQLAAQNERSIADSDRASKRSEDTLRLSGGLPPTLDPAMVQDSTSAEYVVQLFSGLVALNGQLEVVPDLASTWELSQDGLSYTFHLLPEATFQDGKAITAEDFVYALERACSPALRSPVAASYLDDIVGVPEYAKGQAQHIAGIKALDERTLQVTIDAPKAYFLAKLTYPTAFVVDKTQVESQGDNWLRKPNGSGPFVLESLSRERIVLVRNEHYYGKRPILARVEYILSGGLPITMYENDQLDIVEVSPAEVERVSDPGNPLYAEHRVEPQLSVQYLGLNVDAPPFDDPVVRQAFAQAIDKNKLADLVLKNTALPAVGILPPGMPDYDQNLVGLPYDPVRARQLLASSKYAPTMPQVVLAVSGTSGHMDSVTRAILSMIESNLGITVTVEQVEWSYFLRDMNERRYQIYSAGWIGDYPDSQNFLDVLFHSQSSQNHMGYHNREADQLLEQARVEQDPAKRTTLYRQAERIIVNEAPWIPLTHGIQYTLVKPYVKGFRASAAIYPWLRDIYFQK